MDLTASNSLRNVKFWARLLLQHVGSAHYMFNVVKTYVATTCYRFLLYAKAELFHVGLYCKYTNRNHCLEKITNLITGKL